jgi:hypothetical protein
LDMPSSRQLEGHGYLLNSKRLPLVVLCSERDPETRSGIQVQRPLKMQFLIRLETAPLTMMESDQLPSAAEVLLDQLDATEWAHDTVTSFDGDSRTLGARFLIEADNIASVAYSSELVFGFLRCVASAVALPRGGTGSLTHGTVVVAGPEMHIEPAEDLLAKIEVERAPAAA